MSEKETAAPAGGEVKLNGLYAFKEGMATIYNEQGEAVPVTVLRYEPWFVSQIKTQEKDGYVAVQIGAGKAKVKNTSKAMRGHYAKAKVEPKKKLMEFRVSPENTLEVGSTLCASHFVVGQFVDVQGSTKGCGLEFDCPFFEIEAEKSENESSFDIFEGIRTPFPTACLSILNESSCFGFLPPIL